MKQRIVLLGPPASGKGTQAECLVTAFGLPHVSTGDLLRSACAQGTLLGQEADVWTRRGLLVPDELAMRIMTTWIAAHGTRFIFDGFPRTIGQAENLDAVLGTLKAPLDLMVLLELDDQEIFRRIKARLSCLQCGATFSTSLHGCSLGGRCPHCGAVLVHRNDDNTEALEQRLRIYQEQTFPIIGYYEKKSPRLLHRIDAGKGSNEVFKKISNLIMESKTLKS